MTDPKKTESNSDDGIEYIEDDDFSGEKSSKDKIKKLREKLAKCEDEKKQNLAGWQRSKADLINYKKEVEEQKTAYVKIGQESVISELMTVVDAFYSAMKNQTAWESVDSNWRTGVEYIHNQLLKTFAEYNAELIIPQTGDEFNEAEHDISGDTESNKILETIRPGLRINNKIIRTALVKVSD